MEPVWGGYIHFGDVYLKDQILGVNSDYNISEDRLIDESNSSIVLMWAGLLDRPIVVRYFPSSLIGGGIYDYSICCCGWTSSSKMFRDTVAAEESGLTVGKLLNQEKE